MLRKIIIIMWDRTEKIKFSENRLRREIQGCYLIADNKGLISKARWNRPGIPAFRRQRLVDIYEFVSACSI